MCTVCAPDVSTTLPERLPIEARGGGLSVSSSLSDPPAGTSTVAGAARPGAATVHVPPPPPASLSSSERVSECAGRTRPKETPEGSAKRPGASAACTSIMPPPAASTLVGWRCALSLKTGRAVSTSADLICAGVHAGWRWRSSAAAPATPGDAMLVPDQVP